MAALSASGPLAFLPLRDGRCSIVWSTDPAHTDRLLSATDESFMTQLSEAFVHRLGESLKSALALLFHCACNMRNAIPARALARIVTPRMRSTRWRARV